MTKRLLMVESFRMAPANRKGMAAVEFKLSDGETAHLVIDERGIDLFCAKLEDLKNRIRIVGAGL